MPIITPEIIKWIPDKGATNVVLNPAIYLTFSTDMAVSTMNTSNISLSDGANAIELGLYYNGLTRALEIHTLEQLLPNTLYTVTVAGDTIDIGQRVDGVTDILGNPMIGNFTMQFTTGVETGTPYIPGTPPPADPGNPGDPALPSTPFDITSVYPITTASNVSAGHIVIQFNGNVDEATIKDANIYVIKKANL